MISHVSTYLSFILIFQLGADILFREIKTIDVPFSDEFSYGIVQNYSMDLRGSILVAGNKNNGVLIVDGHNQKTKKLEISQCRPGATYFAPYGSFTPDGEILVMNRGNEFYWFNLQGECLHYILTKTFHKKMIPLLGRRIATAIHEEAGVRVRIINYTGHETHERLIDDLGTNLRSVRSFGSTFAHIGGHIVVAQTYSPIVKILDQELSEVRSIKYSSGNDMFAKDDYSYGRYQSIEIREMLRESDSNEKLSSFIQLKDNVFGIVSIYGGNYSIKIFDEMWNPIRDVNLGKSYSMMSSYGNIFSADIQDDGIRIRIYEYK